MERFEVKRGVIKSMGGNAGLAKLATQHFNDVEVNADGVFTASFAILTSVKAEYTDDGKLQVDVEQMKGDDLSSFLSQDGGRERAMQSRQRWSMFLDEATGYSAKQRGDKAKEQAKKFSKARSAIKMAHKCQAYYVWQPKWHKQAIFDPYSSQLACSDVAEIR